MEQQAAWKEKQYSLDIINSIQTGNSIDGIVYITLSLINNDCIQHEPVTYHFSFSELDVLEFHSAHKKMDGNYDITFKVLNPGDVSVIYSNPFDHSHISVVCHITADFHFDLFPSFVECKPYEQCFSKIKCYAGKYSETSILDQVSFSCENENVNITKDTVRVTGNGINESITITASIPYNQTSLQTTNSILVTCPDILGIHYQNRTVEWNVDTNKRYNVKLKVPYVFKSDFYLYEMGCSHPAIQFTCSDEACWCELDPAETLHNVKVRCIHVYSQNESQSVDVTCFVNNQPYTFKEVQTSVKEIRNECHSIDEVKPESITVYFDSTGGRVENDVMTCFYNDSIVLPEVTREGYTFDGWQSLYTAYRSKDMVIVQKDGWFQAKWKRNMYTVSFDTDQLVDYDSQVMVPDVEWKEDKIFVGWKWNDTYYHPYQMVHVTENMIFVPEWKDTLRLYLMSEYIHSYFLSSLENGEIIPDYDANDHRKKDGWYLIGWYCGDTKVIDENGIILQADLLKNEMVLYARWDRQSYVRAKHIEGGKNYLLATSIQNDKAIIVERQGAKSVRKNTTDSVNADTDMIYSTDQKAMWTAVQAGSNLKFYNTDLVEGIDYYLDFNLTYKINVSRDEYFWNIHDSKICYTRWNDGHTDYYYINFTNDEFILTYEHTYNPIYLYEEKELEHCYAAQTMMVMFDETALEVEHGKEFKTLPAKEKEGMSFKGWFNGMDLYKENTCLKEMMDCSFVSVYEKNTYSITYHTYNAINNPNPSVYDCMDGVIKLLPAYKDGYEFIGWYKDHQYTEEIQSIDCKEMKDIELYAKWKCIQYSITYHNVSDVKNRETYTIEDTPFVLNEATRIGYSFLGWCKDETKQDPIHSVPANSHCDLELYADIEPNTYIVFFKRNGSKEVVFDTCYGKMPEAVRDGYTFMGWSYKNQSIDENTIMTIPKNHTLFPTWRGNPYTVFFDGNGGTCTVSQKTVYFDGTYKELPVPERKGYTFIGWYDEEECIDSNSHVEKAYDHTLKANWKANEYEISFDTTDFILQITYDTPYGILPVVSKKGYTFTGWMWNGLDIHNDTIMNTDHSHCLQAQWKANHYKVECLVDDTILQSFEVVYDQCYTDLKPIEKLGYQFMGWYLKGLCIDSASIVKTDSNHVLKAVFEPNSYTIHFSEGCDDLICLYDTEYNVPDNTFIKEGYSFVKWNGMYKSGDVFKNLTDIHNDVIEWKSEWKANTYTVSFDSNSGNDVASISVTYDEKYPVFEKPERVGYKFIGWSYKGKVMDSSNVVKTSKDHTLKAEWIPKKVQIHYSDGNNVIKTIPSFFDSNYTMFTPVKPGYSFVEWMLDGKAIQKDSLIQNEREHTLTARWKANTYTVSFNRNGGSCDTRKISVVYDSTYKTLPDCSRDGYTFTGWFYKNKKIEEGMPVNIAADHALVAQWKANTYSVKCEDLAEKTVTFDEAYGTLPVPERKGYTFIGWKINSKIIDEQSKVLTPYDHVLKSCWKADMYQLKFNANGGSCHVDHRWYVFDQPLSNLPVPTRTGYSFDGWLMNETYINDSTIMSFDQDQSCMATWCANTYTLAFDCLDTTKSVVFDTPIGALPTPSKAGYQFEGWMYNGEMIDETTIYNDCKMTCVAKWSLIPYTIHYHCGLLENTSNNVEEYNVESEPIVLRPLISLYHGFVFDGWYDGQTKIESIPKGSIGNKVIMAHYSCIAFERANDALEAGQSYILAPLTNRDKVPVLTNGKGFISYRDAYPVKDTDYLMIEDPAAIWMCEKENTLKNQDLYLGYTSSQGWMFKSSYKLSFTTDACEWKVRNGAINIKSFYLRYKGGFELKANESKRLVYLYKQCIIENK